MLTFGFLKDPMRCAGDWMYYTKKKTKVNNLFKIYSHNVDFSKFVAIMQP